MSLADREKWDERYRAGAYRERGHPAGLLSDWLPQIPPGRALDVACGSGRNSLFLAEAGFDVDAVDISGEGLARGEQSAGDRGLTVRWIEHDLDAGIPGEDSYDLIVMIRYVNTALLAALPRRLRAGGYLLCEEHLVSTADVIGPQNPRYRVQTGELERAASGLKVVFASEALHRDPDGSCVALAQLVARAPGSNARGRSRV